MFARIALVIWLLLWARTGLPWRSFQWTPSFEHVELVPFTSGSLRGHVLNVLVFVPFGIIARQLGLSPIMAIAAGVGVSLTTECLQVFSNRRYPAITDLMLNTLGTLIGVGLTLGWSRITSAHRPV
jgi:glycopeptide antibiotics resistance protein